MPITFYSNPNEKQKKELTEHNDLKSMIRQFVYNPDQPRAPKGSETGGEWTKAGDQNTSQVVKARGAELVERVAKQLGYDPKKIVVIETGGYKFIVGNRWFEADGSYDPDSGDITIYNSYDLDEKEAQAILAHEIMHSKWHIYWENAKARDDGHGDYQYVLDNIKVLKEKDGVTPYSKAYWLGEKTNNVQIELAINETLAEIGRLKLQGEDWIPATEWMDLFNKVNHG